MYNLDYRMYCISKTISRSSFYFHVYWDTLRIVLRIYFIFMRIRQWKKFNSGSGSRSGRFFNIYWTKEVFSNYFSSFLSRRFQFRFWVWKRNTLVFSFWLIFFRSPEYLKRILVTYNIRSTALQRYPYFLPLNILRIHQCHYSLEFKVTLRSQGLYNRVLLDNDGMLQYQLKYGLKISGIRFSGNRIIGSTNIDIYI